MTGVLNATYRLVLPNSFAAPLNGAPFHLHPHQPVQGSTKAQSLPVWSLLQPILPPPIRLAQSLSLPDPGIHLHHHRRPKGAPDTESLVLCVDRVSETLCRAEMHKRLVTCFSKMCENALPTSVGLTVAPKSRKVLKMPTTQTRQMAPRLVSLCVVLQRDDAYKHLATTASLQRAGSE